MTIDFRDYFWGEKNNGFEVLYHNMKCSHLVSKELMEFIRERSFIEENNSKLLAKLSKQANNNSIQGAFLPLWKVLKSSSEKLSSLHMQMFHGFQELIKDINKYSEEQHKKQKQVKSEELVTVEVVAELKDTIAALNKAKEFYNTKMIEFERLKRENGSQKDIEKAEIRLNKACSDYKSLIDKYGNVKEDFEKKFGVSCQHFQQIEELHITQMKGFLTNYSQVLESGHALIGQIHLEFKEHCNEWNVNKLLEQFVKGKGTGNERPETITFEEADVSTLNSMKSSELLDMTNGEKTVRKEGFLKSKREKVKDKKKKKKSDNSSSKEDNCSIETKDSNSIDLSTTQSNTDTPAVDDEGYVIRSNFANQTNTDNNFYSSSDSDSEDEKQRKIRIKINPLTNGTPISASVDELIASAGSLSLSPITTQTNRRIYTSSTSPTPEDAPIKRSVSANHNISKAESDLISVFSSSMSSASTPSGIPDQNPSNCKNNLMNSNSNKNYLLKNASADRYAALSDLFSESLNESNETRSTTMLSKSMSASILGPPMISSVPRPTSKRNPQTSPQLSHQSSTISRCESASSLSSDFRMTPISVGSSRGPSPLTLGISDAVPIAIALQESVSACFKGIDETKCQVQVIGSLKIAFPAGIVQAFANNPYAAPLTFKLNKSSKIDKIYPNKELLIENYESSQMITTNDTFNFEVNMSALLSSIRRLYENSPNSRYYNIDVLKYQLRCLQGAKSTPLQLVSYWKCEPQSTSLKIDYKYNSSALAQVQPLRNISFSVNIDGGPHFMQSKPEGKWNATARQSLWSFDQISVNSDFRGLGSIKAKFDLTSGPSNPSVIQAQFTCLDTTISGIDFELTGVGYRVSLVKKQISSGRYICEAGV